jgi:hypothetical protein
MATRTLTYKQITDASRLLDLDPDAYPDGVLEKILWNRNALEPHQSNWQRKQLKIARRYAETERDEIRRVEEGEEVHPIEAQMGVHLTDPVAADEAISEQAQEQVEVDLATITLDEARQIETPGAEELDKMEALDQWAFMLELE